MFSRLNLIINLKLVSKLLIMPTIAEKLDLDNRDFSEACSKDRELGQVELFREVLSPLFRFIMINRLVIIHTRNGIGEEITTEQFIYFVMVMLKPIIDDYVATLISTIQDETQMYNYGRRGYHARGHKEIRDILQKKIAIIGQFRQCIQTIEGVKRILDHMVIVLEGESYWNKLVAEEEEKEESEEDEDEDEDEEVKEEKHMSSDKNVSSDKQCIARVFRGGLGGQCYSKKKHGDMCNKHSGQISEYGGLCYGLITEPRPVRWSYKIPKMETAGTKIHWQTEGPKEEDEEEEDVFIKEISTTRSHSSSQQ